MLACLLSVHVFQFFIRNNYKNKNVCSEDNFVKNLRKPLNEIKSALYNLNLNILFSKNLNINTYT